MVARRQRVCTLRRPPRCHLQRALRAPMHASSTAGSLETVAQMRLHGLAAAASPLHRLAAAARMPQGAISALQHALCSSGQRQPLIGCCLPWGSHYPPALLLLRRRRGQLLLPLWLPLLLTLALRQVRMHTRRTAWSRLAAAAWTPQRAVRRMGQPMLGGRLPQQVRGLPALKPVERVLSAAVECALQRASRPAGPLVRKQASDGSAPACCIHAAGRGAADAHGTGTQLTFGCGRCRHKETGCPRCNPALRTPSEKPGCSKCRHAPKGCSNCSPNWSPNCRVPI